MSRYHQYDHHQYINSMMSHHYHSVSMFVVMHAGAQGAWTTSSMSARHRIGTHTVLMMHAGAQGAWTTSSMSAGTG
jgi:hypothetical protein